MKVAIIGSRNLYNVDIEFIEEYIEQHVGVRNITLIISGGAVGIDMLAEEYAESYGIPTKIFYPDYEEHGGSAPIRRNIEIVDMADTVVAFWDKKSKGTKFVIDYAKKRGKKLVEIRVSDIICE